MALSPFRYRDKVYQDFETFFETDGVPVVNVGVTGNIGRGGNDYAAIQAALNSAKDIADNTNYGAKVQLPAGYFVIGSPLLIPPGVELSGAGVTASMIVAQAGTSFPYLIRNEVATFPGQEFWWLSSFGIIGNKANGATVAAGIQCDGAGFVNSGITDVCVFDCTGYGMEIKANGSYAMGPYYIENCWVARNNNHQIMIQGSVQQVTARRVTVERPPTNKYGIYVDGTPGASATASGGHSFRDIHAEINEAGNYAIRLHNTTGIEVDNLHMTGTAVGTQGGVHITGSGTDNYFGSNHIVLKNVYPAAFTYSVNDEVRSKTIAGGKALSLYVTDETYLDKLKAFVGNRFLSMITDSDAQYGWEQNSDNLRFKYVTGNVNIAQYGTDGSTYHYGRNRFDDGNAAVQLKHVAAATPTGGSSGDIAIGNGKIWVNDGGTWKSVAVS